MMMIIQMLEREIWIESKREERNCSMSLQGRKQKKREGSEIGSWGTREMQIRLQLSAQVLVVVVVDADKVGCSMFVGTTTRSSVQI